jgi:hypothetical protein
MASGWVLLRDEAFGAQELLERRRFAPIKRFPRQEEVSYPSLIDTVPNLFISEKTKQASTQKSYVILCVR